MKRSFLKFLVGVVTFSLGYSAAWVYYTKSAIDEAVETIAVTSEILQTNDKLFPTSPNGRIAVYFKEFSRTEDGLAAKFDIVNHNTKAAFYSGYAQHESDKSGHPISEAKVDGREIEQWICGTGLKTFELKSGEKISFSVYGGQLSYFLEKGDDLQIGFGFTNEKGDQYRIYWSEVLQIPTSLKRQLSKEAKEREQNYR